MTSKKAGFTLVELMIVVTVIAVVIGIAIPSLQQSKIRSNETWAIGFLKTIAQASELFYMDRKGTSKQWPEKYDANNSLASGNPPYIEDLNKGLLYLTPEHNKARSSHGYFFIQWAKRRYNTYNKEDIGYEVYAFPVEYGITGIRTFYMDESGVIQAGDAQTDIPPTAIWDNLDDESVETLIRAGVTPLDS